MFNPLQPQQGGYGTMGYNALAAPSLGPNTGTTGRVSDPKAIGSGYALLTPEAGSLGGLQDYYTNITQAPAAPSFGGGVMAGGGGGSAGGAAAQQFNTLGAYLHGTYFKQGKPIPGTNIRNIGQLNQAVFGTPYENEIDYSTLDADKLMSGLGPRAEQMMQQARDWELRDIERQSIRQTGGVLNSGLGKLIKPALGAALTSVGVPAFAIGGALGAMTPEGPAAAVTGALTGAAAGYAGGKLADFGSNFLSNEAFTNPSALGLSADQLYNPAALGGAVQSGVTSLPGGGFINPAALGITANTLASGVPNLANPVYSAPGWTGTTPNPGGGFTNPEALGLSGEDLYNPQSLGGPAPDDWLDKLQDLADPADLLDIIGGAGGEEQTAGTDTGFGAGGTGAGSMPMSMMPQPQAQRSQQLDPVIDAIMNTGAEQGPGASIPEYGAQKLAPGPDVRLPGYQTQPFASAVEQPENFLAA